MDERDSRLQIDFSHLPELDQNKCTTSWQARASSSIYGMPHLEDYYVTDEPYTPEMVLPGNFNNNLEGGPDTIVNGTFNSVCSPALDSLHIIANETFNSICNPALDITGNGNFNNICNSICNPALDTNDNGTFNSIFNPALDTIANGTFNTICHLAPDTVFDGTFNSICDPAPNVVSNGTFNRIFNPAPDMLLFGNSSTMHDYHECEAGCTFYDSLVSSDMQEINHKVGLNPGWTWDEKISSEEGLKRFVVLNNVPELNDDAGSNPEWTSDEQMLLEEGLQKFASESVSMKYIRIAATMRHKTVHDVALRYKWMGIERKKSEEYNARRKGRARAPNKKGKTRKTRPVTNLTSNPPKLKEFSDLMTGELAVNHEEHAQQHQQTVQP